MCKKLIYLVSFVFVLGSVSNAEDIQWTDLGADHLWSTPENWDLGRVPTLADEVRIDVPAAGAPNGPVIQDGTDAKAKGLFNEAPGEPTLTMTGGTLEVAEWIWWGDGADSFGIWDMSGGTVTVANEFELGWDGGAGTLTMTGGTISAGEAVVPTGSGAFGELFLNGGTYNVTKPGGLSVNENGLIDITEGTLVLEGDETAKVNDLIAAGLITAYGGDGKFELDFDGRNPGKTTVSASQLIAYEPFDYPANGLSGNDGGSGWNGAWDGGQQVTAPGLAFAPLLVKGNKATVVGADSFRNLPEPMGDNETQLWISFIGQADQQPGADMWGGVSFHEPDESLFLGVPWQAGPDDKVWGLDTKGDGNRFTEIPITEKIIFVARIDFNTDGDNDTVTAWAKSINDTDPLYLTDKTAFAQYTTRNIEFSRVRIAGNQPVNFDEIRLSMTPEAVLPETVPVDPGTAGLVAYYAFDNDANDSSGNGNDGILEGDPNYVEGPAGYGMALDLDGDDWVNIGTPPDLVITEAITITCWVNPAGIGSEQGFVGLDAGYAFKAHGEGLRFTTPGILDHSSTNITLEAGIWQHVAASFQPGQSEGLVFYYNGAETERITSSAMNPGTGPFRIGNNQWNETLTGLIDEVAIYNRVLSAGEVRYLAGFREIVDPGTDGLAAAYEFETDATDSSGNGNDGTFLGDAHVLGGLLVLDGDDDAVAIPGIGDGLTEFTFSMMVYPTVDVVPLQFSGGINTDSWGGGVHLKLNYGNVNVGLNGLGGGDVVGTSIAQPNTWTHLALTVSPDEVAVYFNGEKEGSRIGEAVPAVNVGAATIGAWNNGGTDVQREMTGMMDNVLIYNRALSEAEVRYLAGLRTDAVNLLPNPSFEEDEPILDDPDWVSWCTWNPAEGAGSNATIVDTESIDGARSLRVEPIGAENWFFILVNISFPANLDKNYTAGFWAKAEAPRPLTIQMKASDNSVDAWGATDFELTTEWAEYSYTSEVLHTDVKLEFLCAGSEVPFWLDLVSVYEDD